MLTNLVNMCETEAKADEEQTTEFQAWCNEEIKVNTGVVHTEQRRIEDTNAILADLRAQKMTLDDQVATLTQHITQETSQLNQARERREEEHAAFSTEAQNFRNAIAACGRAVEILTAHYGDGSSKEAVKPGFMSLISRIMTTVHATASHTAKRMPRGRVASLLQQRNPMNDQYQESTGEGLSIVDQVQELTQSFQEDMQASADEEARMQGLFDTLNAQKTEIIGSLTTELNTQQTQLNQVNQNIAENEGVLQMATELLQDRQAYLATVNNQLSTATANYNARKRDREAEVQATNQAIQVLGAGSLLQEALHTAHARRASHHGRHAMLDQVAAHEREDREARFLAAASRVQGRLAQPRGLRARQTCRNCKRAASLLKQQAKLYHSSVLAMAAASSLGNEALGDVIRQLDGLIDQLNRDQRTEKEHKDWCEQETSQTTQRRTTHQYAVAQIEQSVADVGELISMKVQSIDENGQDINSETLSFHELEQIREQQHEEYEEDMQDHNDALDALNQAINILSEFYAQRNQEALASRQDGSPQIPDASLLQLSAHEGQPASGSRTVEMMVGVRHEFEAAIVELKKNEVDAVAEFGRAREAHINTDDSLHHDRDVLTVEKQTAQQQLASHRRDHASNTAEIQAATTYLSQLNRSCGPLLEHYDDRVKLRKEEKESIMEAKKVLNEV